MTEEEEKAIENLTKLLKQRNEKQVQITTYDLFGNIETVLNILKEKDKEVENYKTVYNKALADLVKADRKNIENKMQIDLMTERIEWLCKSNGILLDKEHDENFTQEDIKQYFKQKATKMSQEGE